MSSVNYRGRLTEFAQKCPGRSKGGPEIKDLGKDEMEGHFVAECVFSIDDVDYTSKGYGANKKTAKREACKAVCENVKHLLIPPKKVFGFDKAPIWLQKKTGMDRVLDDDEKRKSEKLKKRKRPTMHGDTKLLPPQKRPRFTGDMLGAIPDNCRVEMKSSQIGCRLFIAGLPKEIVNQNQFIDMIGRATNYYMGQQILEAWRDRQKPFGFALFRTPGLALRAKELLQGAHPRMRVALATARHRVWVGNLAECISNEKLYRCFATFGDVLRARIATNSDSKSLGWGWVEFAEKRMCSFAVQKLNDEMYIVDKGARPVQCDYYKEYDYTDGLPEHYVLRQRFLSKEIDGSCPPHIADDWNDKEFAMARRWYEMDEAYRKNKADLKKTYNGDIAKLKEEWRQQRDDVYTTNLSDRNLRALDIPLPSELPAHVGPPSRSIRPGPFGPASASAGWSTRPMGAAPPGRNGGGAPPMPWNGGTGFDKRSFDTAWNGPRPGGRNGWG